MTDKIVRPKDLDESAKRSLVMRDKMYLSGDGAAFEMAMVELERTALYAKELEARIALVLTVHCDDNGQCPECNLPWICETARILRGEGSDG